ncbi:MAG: serine kinase, partial [Gammaproteobacteria bacterium]|nr:serine kinase [Gammaproteobacteria bacterium]
MNDTHTPAVSPREFFGDVLGQFRLAESVVEKKYEFFYRIAGLTIKLKFVGDALLPIITPAISHLRIEPHASLDPGLTVYLWDAASTGVNLPTRPWGTDDNVSRGDIRGFDDPRIKTAYTLGPNTLSMFDTEQNLGVFCTTSAAHIPTDYRGSPLLVILSWWTSANGLQYVHAGAVGTNEGGVLLVGKGGSGKSTSALSCIASELKYAADDYCLLDGRAERPVVYSIYNSAKLAADHVARFPSLVPLISNREHLATDKAVIYLNDHHPKKILESFPVKAVFVPKITGRRDTTLSRTSPLI